MSTKSKSSKSSKRQPVNKAKLIRSFGLDKTAKQIVEEAKKIGIRFTDKYVHSIRRMAREDEAKKAAKKALGPVSASGIAGLGLSKAALAAVASASSGGNAVVELLVLVDKALAERGAKIDKARAVIQQAKEAVS